MNRLSISTPYRIAITAFGTSLILALSTAVPDANAIALPIEPEARQHQLLTTGDYDEKVIPIEAPQVELSEEWVKAQEEARLAEEARLRATSEQAERSQLTVKDVPPGVGAQGLVDAAMAQIGVSQDCTDLVQNSLAAIGLTERRDRGGYDLGTGIWQYDHFGTRVDINSLAPGDILIYGNAGSGAHVAIYIGNGQAVHGGWNGYNTAIAGFNSAWQPLTGAIRV